jgi:hypothetical protein
MESSNLVAVLALLVVAAVVAFLLLRFMRSRHGGEVRPLPGPGPASAKADDEGAEYLDSSHIGGPILPGGDPSRSDAAARAAAALRNSKHK